MCSKIELEKKTASELAKICKERGIPHYHGKNRFRKDELVDAILGAEKSAKCGKSAQVEVKIDDHSDGVAAEVKVEKNVAGVKIDMTKKMPYIERAEVGTIVAFRLANGKVKSAMIAKKSTPKRRFMVETQYGATYIVDWEDIVWVRHGKRWPSGVYKLLKGLVGDEAKAV